MRQNLVDKDELSLVITDSGLGGLAICAEIVRNLVVQRMFRNLSVVYFNAWPLKDKGYNLLASDAERTRVFSNSLQSMLQYSPDTIFIACNTLSIVYLQGGLATKTQVPVVDIINFGVDMITAQLNAYPHSAVLILGTKTTVSTGMHKALLMKQGIDANRILHQNCHGLAAAIEQDPGGSQVKTLVDQFMSAAAARVPQRIDHVFVALCCTHYAYVEDLIRERLIQYTGTNIDIINPNQGMSASVKVDQVAGHFPEVDLKIQVVSRVPLASKNIDYMTSRIKRIAPQVAQALQNYERIPNLFDV